MNNLELKALSAFVKDLTGVPVSEIHGFVSEVESDDKFNSTIEANRADVSRNPGSGTRYSVNRLIGTAFYVLCRILKPETVVEAGVASGVSSSYFLCAVEENGKGQLYSIDQPWWDPKYTGWIIPEYLKERWHLTRGRTSEKLIPLLSSLGRIDIYFHDSEHTYKNMLWEYETAWSHMKTGGLLLSHNIDFTEAFTDFCRKVKQEGKVLENLGGLVKD